MDLEPVYHDFLDYLEARGCSKATRIAYRQDLRRLQQFLEEAAVPPAVPSLTGPIIRRYLVWLKEKGYKQWSVRRRICSLRAFLQYCLDEEFIAKHPMARVPTPKAPKTLPNYLTLDEVQRIIRAVDESRSKFRHRDKALVRVLVFTGLRRSELLAMQWEHIDWAHGTLRVTGKGNKQRAIPLNSDTLYHLGTYRAVRLLAGGECVWASRVGGPMTPDSLGRVIRRWLRVAGVAKHATPHTWRHTCATLLVQNGTPVTDVQELLGHTNLATTSIYTHCTLEGQHQAVAKLAQRIDDRSPNGALSDLAEPGN